MLKFLIALVALFATAHSYSIRIVNGTDAGQGEFPFAVALRVRNSFTCGSTILNENYVLTAAHCVCNEDGGPNPAADYSIQYGLTNITTDQTNIIQVAEVTCNDFDSINLIFDSAVLRLETPIPASNPNWGRVTLAREYDTSRQTSGTVIGWGRLYQDGPIPQNLQKLAVDIYDDATCGRFYNLQHHICFGAPVGGACNGDSGTALLNSAGQQVGIASFITNTCGIATPDTPNVYSRVSSYYNWVQGIAGDIN